MEVLKSYYKLKDFKEVARLRKARQSKIILIIEDQVFSQKVLESSIEGDYHIKKALDAIEGLKIYLKLAPDICFLDWQLPGVSGIEFLDVIKKIDPDAFVIMSTSHNTAGSVQTAIKKGVSGYISKPFTKSKISKYLTLFNEKIAS